MPDQVVEVGEKVHVITRRLFDGDIRRRFVGEVTRVSAGLQEVCGYAFVFNPNTNEYKKRPELRTRLFRLGDAGLVVFKIPRNVVLESIGLADLFAWPEQGEASMRRRVAWLTAALGLCLLALGALRLAAVRPGACASFAGLTTTG